MKSTPRHHRVLQQQLDEAKAKLDDQDAKLADFERKNLGSLPDEEQTNMNLLIGLNTAARGGDAERGRLQQEKAFDESMLAQQVAAWKQAQETHGQDPSTLQAEKQAAEAKLTALQAQYTDEYPDVVKAKQELDAINQKIAAAQQAGPRIRQSLPTDHHGTDADSATARAGATGLDRRGWSAEQEQALQGQIGALQSRVKASPEVEEDYKEITRNYQTAQDFYNDLLKKHAESAEATDLEHEQEGEQFRILDLRICRALLRSPIRCYFPPGDLAPGWRWAWPSSRCSWFRTAHCIPTGT